MYKNSMQIIEREVKQKSKNALTIWDRGLHAMINQAYYMGSYQCAG